MKLKYQLFIVLFFSIYLAASKLEAGRAISVPFKKVDISTYVRNARISKNEKAKILFLTQREAEAFKGYTWKTDVEIYYYDQYTPSGEKSYITEAIKIKEQGRYSCLANISHKKEMEALLSDLGTDVNYDQIRFRVGDSFALEEEMPRQKA